MSIDELGTAALTPTYLLFSIGTVPKIGSDACGGLPALCIRSPRTYPRCTQQLGWMYSSIGWCRSSSWPCNAALPGRLPTLSMVPSPASFFFAGLRLRPRMLLHATTRWRSKSTPATTAHCTHSTGAITATSQARAAPRPGGPCMPAVVVSDRSRGRGRCVVRVVFVVVVLLPRGLI
jgi:hypothetical protein